MYRTLASLVLCLAACDRSPPPRSEPVLRTYHLPAGTAARVTSTLTDVFQNSSKDQTTSLARADATADGHLVVLAPESLQAGVKSFVETVSQNPPKPAQSLSLTYWVVTGTPGIEQKEPIPSELEPALNEVRKTDGPQAFRVVEKLKLSAGSGEWAKLMGRETSIEQSITTTGPDLLADIRLERRSQKLSTRMRLSQGRMIVLASSGSPTREPNEPPQSVFFLVKASPSTDAQ